MYWQAACTAVTFIGVKNIRTCSIKQGPFGSSVMFYVLEYDEDNYSRLPFQQG